jgi:uncharacterized protein YukE
MVTYRQLWRASPTAWAAAGAEAGRLARHTARDASVEVASQVTALRAAWSGAAAQVAAGRLLTVRDRLEAFAALLVALDQALAEHAARLAEAKAMLSASVAAAAGARVTVDRDGRVDVDRTGEKPDPGDVAVARRTAAGVEAALALAAEADARTARRLAELSGWCEPGPAEPPGGVPEPTYPAAVRAWWAGLTGPQRRWLILHRPDLIGSLDGVPAAARDQANRLLLARVPADDLADLRAWLRDAGRSRAYLLRLDLNAGRAVVSLGDPDLADHVLVHVPGARASIDRIGVDLARADRVAARAAEIAPGASVAAVVWLDYDVPASLPEAARTGYARDAGPDLRRFVDGLRATHDTRAPHVTVLGHSYGSLVVATTARDHGLAADDVVFVGSPGVGVSHVDQLPLPDGHVWSTTARQDPIQLVAPSPAQVARDIARSAAMPWYAGIAPALPDEDLWHGRNPSLPQFGARIFASAARASVYTAHTAYWDAGNPALESVARITLGGSYHAAVR